MLAHVFPDDRCAVLSRDLNRTAASLDSFAAGDGAAWRRLAAGWAALEQPLLDALFTPLPALGPASRMLGRLGIGGSLRMARMALLPVRRLGEELFQGEGGTILLAGNALHADLPPEGAGSAVYGWLLAMLGQHHGFPVPVGGAGKLVEAMVRRLAARGGELRLASPVAAVEIRGRRATGVRLASGERISARRAVLADVPAPILFGDLVGESRLPARFGEDLAAFPMGCPDAEGGLGAQRPDSVAGRRCARRRHGAPGRRPGRADQVCRGPGHQAVAGSSVPAAGPDDHRRRQPITGRHRVRPGPTPTCHPASSTTTR